MDYLFVNLFYGVSYYQEKVAEISLNSYKFGAIVLTITMD